MSELRNRKTSQQTGGIESNETAPVRQGQAVGDQSLPNKTMRRKRGPRRKRMSTFSKGYYAMTSLIVAIAVPAFIYHSPNSPYYTGVQFNEKLRYMASDISAYLAQQAFVAYNQTSSFVEDMTDYLMIGDLCPYVEDTVAAVQDQFPKRIKGQNQAFAAIEKAFLYWEMGRSNSKSRTPLVLAITGPTGVGKTETAHVLGEALLRKRKVSPSSQRTTPSGLIIFRGEDFADLTEMPITRYHTEIKSRLVNHLRHCNGNAVVLFDEVQKVVPGTLDVLTEAMTEHPTLTFFSNGESVTVDCSKVIFILVSDIGWEKIVSRQLMFETREQIPAEDLRRVVKQALDEQWKYLRFGKIVDEVIPYLPMEQEQMQEVLALKLQYLNDHFQGEMWKKLCVTEQAQAHLVSHRFIIYKQYKTPLSESMGIVKDFAEYGARNIENSGPLKVLKTQIYKTMQPWQPEKLLVVHYHIEADQVQLFWCGSKEVGPGDGVCPSGDFYGKTVWDANLDCIEVWTGALDESQ